MGHLYRLGLPKSDEYRRFTQEAAMLLGWNYDELKGDPD